MSNNYETDMAELAKGNDCGYVLKIHGWTIQDHVSPEWDGHSNIATAIATVTNYMREYNEDMVDGCRALMDFEHNPDGEPVVSSITFIDANGVAFARIAYNR